MHFGSAPSHTPFTPHFLSEEPDKVILEFLHLYVAMEPNVREG